MKKLTSLSFAAVTALLTATALFPPTAAYSQTPIPLYQHLPPSADHIYSIKLGQIIMKGQLTELLNNMPPSKDPHAAMAFDILKDPASAGIDLSHETLIARTTATGTGADTVSYTQVLIPLTDTAKLRTTLTGAMPDLHIHRIPGKGNTAFQKKMGMAWNDRLLVITSASASLPKLSVEKSLAALTGFSGTPWLTDQRFVTGFSTDEDIHAWSQKMDFMNMMSRFIKKMAAKNPALKGHSLPDYSKMSQIPHPPVLSTFDFEDGRIIFRMTTYNKPEDAAMLRKAYDRPIDKDLLARVPAGLLLGCAAIHINPAAFPDMLDKYHSRKMIDSMLGKHGLTINDITSVFGGDFLVAALGDTTAVTDTTKKKVGFYIVASLGDPSKLMQLAAKLTANGAATDTAKAAKMKKLAENMVIRDNLLVISNSKEAALKYFEPHAPRSTNLLDADNSIQAVAIDLKAVSAFITATQSNNPKSLVFARILEKLDKLEVNTSLPGDNNTVATIQIVTGDPSTNSLKTLVGLMH
ncbi:MAG TPA: DUF4836 family protein [Puia sp.]|nr:DUF4836 family protein [Puia sp.]